MRNLAIIVFYAVVGFLALGICHLFHCTPWQIAPMWHSIETTGVIISGLGLGLGVVIISWYLDRFSPFARLDRVIARFLPPMGFVDILILSAASAVGEELLFRGALLQLIGLHGSSFLFGFLHYGGKRSFLLWGFLGWGMGYLLGGLFLVTGSLLAPVLAHFTVNYFNLIRLMETRKIQGADTPVSP